MAAFTLGILESKTKLSFVEVSRKETSSDF
jgi:hypothetical protein